MKKQKANFEKAMTAASFWCNAWDQGELSDEVLADKIFKLLKEEEGARGFFVISLSSESPLMDRLPEALIHKLREAGESVVDLTVKNLAMSSAMEAFHKSNQNLDQQNSSGIIKRRCIELLRLLDSKLVKEKIEKMIQASKGEGEYALFFKRWNYGTKEINAIIESINSIIE